MRKLLSGRLFSLLLCWFVFLGAPPSISADYSATLTETDRAFLASIFDRLPGDIAPADRIVGVSELFLGTPYRADTLIGGPSTPEALVADFAGFDCFTFLDIVESLRRSASEAEFLQNLVHVRYRNKLVSYLNRRHFFSDWVSEVGSEIVDVTQLIAPDSAKQADKLLNKRSEQSVWLDGLPITERSVTYIPTEKIDGDVLEKLKAGDYLGIYTDKQGLDVQHTGILIRHGGKVQLRHASSAPDNTAVVDEDLMAYLLDGRQGLVVYRVMSGH